MQTEKGQMMDKREAPIAVFDSGMGGVSVLRELIKTMPEEDFYYFGDSKNAPYGTKSTEKVRELAESVFFMNQNYISLPS